MSLQSQAAEEILAGMYAGLRGRTPNPAVQAKIDELEAQIEAGRNDRRCRCGAIHHGGDCMCFED